MTDVAKFSAESQEWRVCEYLDDPGGAIHLLPANGAPVVLSKSYEPYNQGTDDDYYLGLGKQAALGAKWDMLGQEILHSCPEAEKVGALGECEPTWERVERAVPVIRYSGGDRNARAGSNREWMCSPYGTETGVRTFVGSRSSSVDATCTYTTIIIFLARQSCPLLRCAIFFLASTDALIV